MILYQTLEIFRPTFDYCRGVAIVLRAASMPTNGGLIPGNILMNYSRRSALRHAVAVCQYNLYRALCSDNDTVNE